MASDGSYIPAEVSRNNWIDIEVEVEQSMLSYLGDLNQELASLSPYFIFVNGSRIVLCRKGGSQMNLLPL